MKKRNVLILLLVLVLLAAVLLFVFKARQDAAGPDTDGLVSLPVAEESAPSYQSGNPGGLTLDGLSIENFRADTPFVELYNNEPGFRENELSAEPFETYAPLDGLGRCGTAYANLCRELMPTGERGSIGHVKPSGWQSVRYDNVDGKNMVADYIKETGNHVLYRVTPVFCGDNLVADGVQMEALSVEDEGDGICFNVFCYNAQPGIAIDYATGESHAQPGLGFGGKDNGEVATYVLNTGSKKFHLPDCSGAGSIKAQNKETFTGTRAELTAQGYQPCGSCKP